MISTLQRRNEIHNLKFSSPAVCHAVACFFKRTEREQCIEMVHLRCFFYDTIRYDTRCYFNVRSKANMSQLNLPH